MRTYKKLRPLYMDRLQKRDLCTPGLCTVSEDLHFIYDLLTPGAVTNITGLPTKPDEPPPQFIAYFLKKYLSFYINRTQAREELKALR